MPGDALIQSIVRADDILNLLSENNRPLPLPDIKSALNLAHPTVFNMLRTLVSVGLVQRVKTGKLVTYMLGTGLDDLALSRRRTRVNVWLNQNMPILLSKLSADSVSFTVFQEDAFYVIRRLGIEQPLETPDHWMAHPYASAASLVLAAYMPMYQLDPLYAKIPFSRYGLEAWTDEQAYTNTLTVVRHNGFALTGNPNGSQPVDIAVPYFAPPRELQGAITVHWNAYPTALSPQQCVDNITPLLLPLP